MILNGYCSSTKMKQPQNSDSETEESEIRQILALEIARRHLFSAPCSSGEKASSHPQELCQYQNMTKQGVIVSEDIWVIVKRSHSWAFIKALAMYWKRRHFYHLMVSKYNFPHSKRKLTFQHQSQRSESYVDTLNKFDVDTLNKPGRGRKQALL